MPGGAADFIVGAEVRPVGSGLKTLAADTKALTAATKQAGEEDRRAAASAAELEKAERRQREETRQSTQEMRRAEAATRDLEQAERRRRAFLEQMVQSIRAQNLALAQARTDHAQYQQKVEAAAEAKRRATGVVNSFRAAIVALQVAVAALGLGALVRDSVNVALAFDRSTKSLVAAAGSQQAAGREMAFVAAEADRLGLVLTTTTQTYAGLANAAKGTVLQGQATRDIFSAVSEAATVLGLSAEQTQGALLGVQQTISKGKVTSEELVQQISERLPGAYQAMADSLGITTAELAKRLEQSKVGLKDLVGWAEELRKRFAAGLTTAVNSYQANINRLTNLTQALKREVGEGFLAGFLTGFADLKKALSAEELKAAARDLGESIGKALRTAADLALVLTKYLEEVKAVLLVIVSLKAASWFVSLAGAIASATGSTLIFKGALSSLAIAGPLAAIGIALLAVIVLLERYITTTRLAHEAEMAKVAKSQELFGYYQTLRANKIGLTEAEAGYAIEVRKTMEAEKAALAVAIARSRAQISSTQGYDPFSMTKRSGLMNQLVDQERELKTIENQIKILDKEWTRLGKLPTIKLPVDTGQLDGAAKKVADLLTGFQRTAEQAERIRAAQERGGASEVARVTAEIERQNAAYQSLHSMEGLSATSKTRLSAIIEGLVGRAQDANRATAEGAAETQRSLAFTAAAAEAEARLADAKGQTSASSRAAAMQTEADTIAREHQREEDSAYVAGLLQIIRVREEYLAGIALEIAAVERQIAHASTLRQKQAELADAQGQTTAATSRLTVELEAENEARARGIQIGSIWHQLLLAISASRAQEIAGLDQQTAAQRRLNEAEAGRARARAEFTDWNRQRAAAKEYGDEIAGILRSFGLLSEATRDLAIHEQALAIRREEGGARTIEQIEAELRGYAAIEESLARVAAATEMQAYVVQPVVDAWAQVGQMLQDAVIDAIVEGKVEVEDLAKTILRTMLQAIAEMLKRWILAQRAMQAEAMRTAAVNAAAAQAGGGGGGIGSNLTGTGSWVNAAGAVAGGSGGSMAGLFGGSAMGGGAAGGLAAVGAWAAVWAIVYFAVSQWIKTSKDQIAEVTLRLGEEGKAAVVGIHGDAKRVSQLTDSVQKAGQAAVDFIKSIGGQFSQLGDFSQVDIGRTGQGSSTSFYVRMANGAKLWFASYEDALQAGIIEALKNAEITGLDPIVLAAIKRSTARTMEEFQAGIADALKVASFGSAAASGDFRAVTAEMDRLRASMIRLLGAGDELNDALARITAQEVLLLQAQRDAITGKQRTAAEDLKMRQFEAQVWNAELALRKANVAAAIYDLKAKIAAYQATGHLIDGGQGGGGGGGRRGRGILGVAYAALVAAGAMNVLGDVLTGTGDAALDAMNAQLKGLEDLLAALGNMKPIDLGEIRPGSAGGAGGDRAGARADLLDEVKGWKLTDIGRALQETGRWFDDFKDRIKDMGFSAAKQAELLALAAEELKRRQAEIKAQQLGASRDFINAGTAAGGPLLTGLRGLDKTQKDLIQANRDLWRSGQLSLREMRELNNAIREAGERQREQMVTSAADSLLMDLYGLLGMDKEAAQLRFDLTVAELEIRREELAIAMEALGWEQARRDVILGSVDDLIRLVKEKGPGIFGPPGGGDPGPVFHGYGPDTGGAVDLLANARALMEQYRAGLERDEFAAERKQIEADFLKIRQALGDIPEVAALYADVMADLAARIAERDDELLRPFEELGLSDFEREMAALEREFAHIRETVADADRVEAAHALALQDLMKRYTEGLRSFYDDLMGGAASGLTIDQQYNAAMAKYSSLLASVQAGDLSKSAELQEVAQLLTQLGGQMWGTSTGGFAELRQRILDEIGAILGLTGGTGSSPALDSLGGGAPGFAGTPGSSPTGGATAGVVLDFEPSVRATREVTDAIDRRGARAEVLLEKVCTRVDRLADRVVETLQDTASIGYG